MSCCTCGYGRTLHANPDGPQENDQNVVPASSIPDPTELVCQPPKRPAAAAAAAAASQPLFILSPSHAHQVENRSGCTHTSHIGRYFPRHSTFFGTI